jgi:hypothetical protein
MTSYVKPVGIALTGEHVAALLADRRLTARLNASGLPFAVAGVDRVDSAALRSIVGSPHHATEPTFAVTTLADWAPDLGWLAVGAVLRDRPGTLARRMAWAGQRSGGRLGLVLGRRDRSAPAGDSLSASPEAARDAAAEIRAHWHRRVSGAGSRETAPASPPGAPVLAWRAESTGEAAAAGQVADILIWPAGRPERLVTVAAASAGRPRLFLELPAGGSDLGPRLASHLADEHTAGVILRVGPGEMALREFVAQALPVLASSGVFRTGRSGTLRERLALVAAEPRSGPGSAALPVRGPEPALTAR